MSAASQTSLEKDQHHFVDENEAGHSAKGLTTAEILSRVDEKKLVRKIDYVRLISTSTWS